MEVVLSGATRCDKMRWIRSIFFQESPIPRLRRQCVHASPDTCVTQTHLQLEERRSAPRGIITYRWEPLNERQPPASILFGLRLVPVQFLLPKRRENSFGTDDYLLKIYYRIEWCSCDAQDPSFGNRAFDVAFHLDQRRMVEKKKSSIRFQWLPRTVPIPL